ncbi:DUF2778 domain-containing protein [Helicobacter sp. MIT 14-3879]|uniref:DUF2778 domain-containing protein n=1 Tax=Helicobacter sp. MIT 14-3879 TaxID=2040649 RepID=UPI000E1E6373|nr:DUF2778 domain-containing protein [Helicobacter sp. MIT 14-3879]RDU60227.1 hypothetical protein CQA44_10695 [Helicobacter sp. MIT 14-3879]
MYEEGEKQPKILATLASNDNRLVYEILEKSKEKEDKYASISLKFNGKFLTIIIKENNNEIKRISFQAVSGRPKKDNGKHYFTYEKERQMLKDERPIPEGEYYITPLSENKDDGVQELSIIDNIIGSVSWVLSKVKLPKRGEFYGSSFVWGTIRIPIQPKTKTFTDSEGQTITRNNFFIHGGVEAGSAGCIDLWKDNEEFFKIFLAYVEKYRDRILKNQGKIPLVVKYEDSTKIECDNAAYTKYCKPIGKESK